MVSFQVSVASGGDWGLNEGVRKSCEVFCNQAQFSLIPSDAEREKANSEIVHRLTSAHPKHNVMVVAPGHSQSFQEFSHIQVKVSWLTFFSSTLHVYVFRCGGFTLHGDGGSINWCFSGNFKRDGKNVTFYDR